MITFEELQAAFDRALSKSYSKKKWLMTFIVLALCGLLVVFFRGLTIGASRWVMMSLTLMPFFLCAGVLLSLGIVLISIYHDEVKRRPFRYRDIFTNSWDLLLGSFYFSIPMILGYLVLWIFLGVFVLLRMTPGVGEVFGVILAFAPFIINFAILTLCLFNAAMLFFLTPILALKGLDRVQVAQSLEKRFKGNALGNLVLFKVALIPAVIIGLMLIGAGLMTGKACYVCQDALHNAIQWFFIMIPFTAILAPAVIFFFNFAVEAHVLLQKSRQ